MFLFIRVLLREKAEFTNEMLGELTHITVNVCPRTDTGQGTIIISANSLRGRGKLC
jgi:hypothetical protein